MRRFPLKDLERSILISIQSFKQAGSRENNHEAVIYAQCGAGIPYPMV